MKKIMAAFILGAGVCSVQALTPVGGDDFNDNSLDTNKWVQFLQAGGAFLGEANGRLEFTASQGSSNQYDAWQWNGGGCSYTQDWRITFDTVNLLDETTIINDETHMGFAVFFGSLDNIFGIDHNKGNDGSPYNSLTIEGNTGGASDVLEYRAGPSDAITFSIAFDAQTKTLSTSFNEGYGFVPVASMDVSGWGMGDTDEFDVLLNGGNAGMQVGSGQVYGDNFTIWNETPTTPDLVISNGIGNVALDFQTDAGLYYELWATANLTNAWSGPLQTVSGSNHVQTLSVPTVGHPSRYFQMRGFEMAPELASFTSQVVGTTLPGTLTHIDSATRFTYNGTESGDWSYAKTGRNTALLVFTYDPDNDPANYREEIVLLYTGKDAGNYRYSEYSGEEDSGSVAYGTFTF